MKETKQIALVCTMLLIGGIESMLYGQQDPEYTQYMYNQNVINPAYAGSGADLSISTLGRTQWVNLDGSPNTQTLNVSGILGKGIGAAFNIVHDVIGPVEESVASLDIAYHLPVSEKGKLSFGVKGSYNFLNIGLRSRISEMGLTVAPNDPLFIQDVKKNAPNMGVGVYYYSDRFYTGISVPFLLEKYNFKLNNSKFITDVSDHLHIFGTMGYVFDLKNNLKLKPSTMVKMVEGSPISIDLNASLFINDKFEVGLSWREGDSLDGLLGFQVSPTLRVGYAYDHTLTKLGNFNSGSHELMLLFDLNFTKTKIKSPRYF